MVKRKIVKIDEEKCDGCGQCVPSCEEGAIKIIDGKARLVSEVYCDGLGACLGECPQDAISLAEREAQPFDEAAVAQHLQRSLPMLPTLSPSGGCPGTAVRQLAQAKPQTSACETAGSHATHHGRDGEIGQPSGLANWPVQLHLVPPQAPYLQSAEVLLVADCVPFACADFHRRFLDGRPVVIGCPKLDDGELYVQKLAQMIRVAGLRRITVLHMEVPCCMGLVHIVRAAMALAEVTIPLDEVTVSVRGEVLDQCADTPGH